MIKRKSSSNLSVNHTQYLSSESMKRLFTLMCFIGLIQITIAQNFTSIFGKCSEEEVKLQKYDKDPVAEAVVIFDAATSHFAITDAGLALVFEHKMKIKIFNKAGLKWADFSIPYSVNGNNSEEITELEGNTYNWENDRMKKSALNPKTAFEEKVDATSRNLKFAMPDVKEGSVIEISYKITSPSSSYIRPWEFQKSIPVVQSTFTVKMIPFYEYTNILQGANKYDNFISYTETGLPRRYAQVDFNDIVYIYGMQNLPAFRDESYITSPNDYIVKLNFQLSSINRPNGAKEQIVSTWPKLSEELISNEYFGKYQKTCQSRSKDFLDTMKFASKSLTDKAQKIEHFVKTNFKWDGYNTKFTDKSVKDFLKSKTGSSAEINLFLAGMLNAAGLEAYPVIISTRSHGKIKTDYPFLHFFNAVLVYVKLDTISVLLDATEPFSNFTEIPTRCINDNGLIIKKDKVEWVSTKSNIVSTNINYITLQPNPVNDSLIQNFRFITTGYEAIKCRNRYSESYKTLKENLIGNNASAGDSLKSIGLKHIEAPFELDFNKRTSLEKVEDKIIISPFSDIPDTENPLKQSSRNYPVDLIYKKLYAFETTIEVPKGYKLYSKPEALKLNDNMVRIIFSATELNKNTIKVIGLYEFKKEEYQAVEYLYLKDYFNKIVDKFNEKLVLIKES